jgi:hypothetical protein
VKENQALDIQALVDLEIFITAPYFNPISYAE